MTSPHRAAGADQALLPVIGEFNFLPGRYLHSSWLQALPYAALLDKLRRCPRSEARVSRYLLDLFGLGDQYWFDFTEPLLRIALLKGVALDKLVFFAGLVCVSSHIQHAVLRAEVQQLRHSLGDEAYGFALKRAPFLVPAGSFPESERRVQGIRFHALLTGLHCLSGAFAGRPPALTRRLLLKLPQAWQARFDASSWRAAQDNCAGLLTKLVTELKLEERSDETSQVYAD